MTGEMWVLWFCVFIGLLFGLAAIADRRQRLHQKLLKERLVYIVTSLALYTSYSLEFHIGESHG